MLRSREVPTRVIPVPAFASDQELGLVFLVVLGQLLDLATFVVITATGVPGTEAGPLGSVLATLGPGGVIVAKSLAITAIALGAFALRHRSKFLWLLAAVGFFGAFMNTTAILTA